MPPIELIVCRAGDNGRTSTRSKVPVFTMCFNVQDPSPSISTSPRGSPARPNSIATCQSVQPAIWSTWEKNTIRKIRYDSW